MEQGESSHKSLQTYLVQSTAYSKADPAEPRGQGAGECGVGAGHQERTQDWRAETRT